MTIHFPSIEPLKHSKILLLGIAVGIITIHLNITWKSGATELLTNSIIFWTAVCSLVWTKRHTLNLKTEIISSLLGALIIAALLLKSLFPVINFLYVLPVISAVGIGLIASGFKGLKQYRSELLLLFFLGVPYVTLLPLIDPSELTAKIAAFVLWYLGFEVSRSGVDITLSTGIVEVYQGCSGMKNILDMWRVAVLLLVMFPTDGRQKILVPVAATFIGFAVNLVRVVLMAILLAFDNRTAFEYWHEGDGSLVFSMISVLILSLFCFLMLRLDQEPEKQNV